MFGVRQPRPQNLNYTKSHLKTDMREQAEKDDSLQRGNKNDACLDIVLQV